MLGEKRPQKSRGFSRASPQANFSEPKNAPRDLPRLRENLSPATSPANLPSSMAGGCGSGVQLHSRGDVSASEASTRPSSPVELAPATSAASEAEVAKASSLESGDHGISAGDDHAAAERCPDGVCEAMVNKFPDLDQAWKSKESGGEQLQIRATDSLVFFFSHSFLVSPEVDSCRSPSGPRSACRGHGLGRPVMGEKYLEPVGSRLANGASSSRPRHGDHFHWESRPGAVMGRSWRNHGISGPFFSKTARNHSRRALRTRFWNKHPRPKELEGLALPFRSAARRPGSASTRCLISYSSRQSLTRLRSSPPVQSSARAAIHRNTASRAAMPASSTAAAMEVCLGLRPTRPRWARVLRFTTIWKPR